MQSVTLLQFIINRLPELWLRTGEHILLTLSSTVIAILIGIPLGILAYRTKWLRDPLLGCVGILQTIPSLAMLAILLALIQKIGAIPAIIALVLYALLPIVRNTLTGLEGVSPAIAEASRGIGMTPKQQLWMVKIPLAMPVIVAGIRTASVVGVGIATLSAFIGAGGLGQFINRGLALSNTRLILLGAIPAAILALLVDSSIAAANWGLKPVRQKEKHALTAKLKPLTLSFPIIIALIGIFAYFTGSTGEALSTAKIDAPTATIRIGSKNFTEQFILSELMSQLIEEHTNLSVKRLYNLGGTMICHNALKDGEIDLYAEYTGTALTAILKQGVITNPDLALDTVRAMYRKRFNLEWLNPFGFNNTYAITVRESDSKSNQWETISDMAPSSSKLRAGFTSEFVERPDGYPGLRKEYGLAFAEVRDFDPAIMYQAEEKKEVDVICAFATDGRIAAFHLKPLVDNHHFFPPYYAAPVVREEILESYPDIRKALAPLNGLLTDSIMQNLNYQVDQNKKRPRVVAREFLESHGLL